MNLDFYKGKTVLVTGHTGFKGTWLTKILVNIGANVIGYALEPNTNPNLFTLSKIEKQITHIIGDITDYKKLKKVFDKYKPEIVFHLAAQPIVLEGYRSPRNTYNVNVMGVVNLFDCIKESDSVKTVVNITTDKVYQNLEKGRSFKETDILNGFDPYSNSKSCSELVTECYYKSFLKQKNITVITMRAGNVIGGGDFADNRIIPDCVRAAQAKKPIIIRNPNSIRPYQHVLEPLFVYLLVGTKTYKEIEHFNIGPLCKDCKKTEDLVKLFCKHWPKTKYIIEQNINAPHEAGLLLLNCRKIRKELSWEPVWSINTAIKKICGFYKNKNVSNEMDKEINDYISDYNKKQKRKEKQNV